MKYTLLILTGLLLCAASCKTNLKPDPWSALAANDYTGLIESPGCGFRVESGFAVCRKEEETSTAENLYFIAPPAVCDDPKSCVSVSIFFPDGSPSIGFTFPKGKTRLPVAWSQLLKRDTFEVADRGFWGFVYYIKYRDLQGNPRETRTQGEIYLRVTKKGYVSFENVTSSNYYVWNFLSNGKSGQHISMTTGGRTYVRK